MESEEYESSLLEATHELDLTNHHENITTGIQTLKKLYNLSTSGAKAHLEAVYIEKISKFPQILPHLQEKAACIKSFLQSLQRNSVLTQFTFTLLKCNHLSGTGWVEISGFSESLTLSFMPPSFTYSQNSVGDISYKILAGNSEVLGEIEVNLWKRLGKLPADQIIYCKSLLIFENFKNTLVDCCFWLSVDLSDRDKRNVLQIKHKETSMAIERLRIDSQGFNIRNEFKSGCCECAVF